MLVYPSHSERGDGKCKITSAARRVVQVWRRASLPTELTAALQELSNEFLEGEVSVNVHRPGDLLVSVPPNEAELIRKVLYCALQGYDLSLAENERGALSHILGVWPILSEKE